MLTTAATRSGTPLQIVDKVPVTSADPRGVVPFYLNVGYVLGGYLASTVLGISAGTCPRTARRAGLRIAALAVYSVLLGIAGAVVVGPVLDIWHHDVPTIAAIGALAVFAAAMFASAIQGRPNPLRLRSGPPRPRSQWRRWLRSRPKTPFQGHWIAPGSSRHPVHADTIQ